MASKGPRSKLDHESRAKRQKALEAPKEPQRPKTHWDHVLEEMVWLSKDFESERKWKLAQAKKVAVRASKGFLDQATRGEKRLKEEEQKLRKVALNISKDVKKFWTKIEKLVLYKHQLELDEKKKRALDKQLEFLLGQTERYSSMLAENLLGSPTTCKPSNSCASQKQLSIHWKRVEKSNKATPESDSGSQSNVPGADEDFDLTSDDESEDDEHTLEEDEALITKEERDEELAALHSEIDLPLEEILKRYAAQEVNSGKSPESDDNVLVIRELGEENGKEDIEGNSSPAKPGRRCVESNGVLSISEKHSPHTERNRIFNKKLIEPEKRQMFHEFNEEEDDDFKLPAGEEKDHDMDDETTLIEEEELASAEPNNNVNEIDLLHKESEIPIEELLARYKEGCDADEDMEEDSESLDASSSDNSLCLLEESNSELKKSDDLFDDLQLESCQVIEEDEVEHLAKSREDTQSEDIIANAAAAARSAQPTGNTFSTTKVRTKFPFLLKYPLREYQHIGLDWLVTMYEKRLNGILADEMGLGKTIMTIALLAHLACEKGIWGPHLIVVPTSVMLNWETEFLKWCPAFKILTYFGSAKDRKIKRQGWMKPNSFHVCITTYRLVIQDCKVFKRKKWKYLILDEAHLIKNWKSQRWQTLLNFNSKRRILLTGTPLQNDLMELWSLMHFLMPHIFQSHQEFKDWFSNPISGMVEGQDKVNKEVVDRLHNVLRPFILRRLKRDVEKQLPKKHEHVIFCRLSRRQRNLYEDFIASSETQATLASANFFGMIGVIMQLRKVCNHPDLFEGRPIISSYDMSGINVQLSSSICSMLASGPFSAIDLSGLGFVFTHLDFSMTSWESEEIQAIATPSNMIEHCPYLVNSEENPIGVKNKKILGTNIFEDIRKALLEDRQREAKEWAASVAWWNSLRCRRKPVYSTSLRELVTVNHPIYDIHKQKQNPLSYSYSSKLAEIVLSPVERFGRMVDQVESFMFAIPAARAPPPVGWCSKGQSPVFIHQTYANRCSEVLFPLLTPFRAAIVRRQVYFPDRRLIQFDCGKLQELAVLLRRLKSEGHRALIFTQMTKMLDILEAFINIYGYTYMRLDGSTQPEERQTLMQRFNTNPKYFLFILSTRSGGVGINLVGADTVIFYDSDWNPAMDQQAQDRCHRIGQTREVNIYRLISESTIEENILKKSNQKRALDNLVIQSGSYNTEFFKKLDPMDLFSGHQRSSPRDTQTEKTSTSNVDINLSSVDLEAALKNAEDEADYMALKKVEEEEAVDNQEFTEEAVGKLEDDELVNEDDLKLNEEEMKTNDPLEYGALVVKSDEPNVVGRPVEDEAIDFPDKEDDIDMLADVKQMAAAAAAAGQAILSFENQLRPIDRYAIRFMELWDPILDKAATVSHIQAEEKEWELEHIEKLKDDMEAENDDDEDPLIYESWDADFATEIYRQQVEALAQQQLVEDLEREAREKEALENCHSDSPRNDVLTASKSKSKKKTKKAKFKSLKKEALVPMSVPLIEESSLEPMLIDDDQCDDDLMTSSDTSSPCSAQLRKRKCASEYVDNTSGKKPKKLKASEQERMLPFSKDSSKHSNGVKDAKVYENGIIDLDSKQIGRTKVRGKLSISVMPLKLTFLMKPEKIKKKWYFWSLNYIPFPDLWSPHEDAVLCASVHEYGPNWNLASEILHGMTSGGFYRGRFRHPFHCSERFRELIQRHVLSVSDAINNDKGGSVSSGKALLKVTQDNIHALLGIVSQLPDQELLLQKHFFALLSAAWRDSCRTGRRNKSSVSSHGGFYPFHNLLHDRIKDYRSTTSSEKMEFTNLNECGKMVAAALNACCSDHLTDDRSSSVDNREKDLVIKERLDLSLEPQGEKDEISPLPTIIKVSIFGTEPQPSLIVHPDSRIENPVKTLSGVRNDRNLREFPIDGAWCSNPWLLNSGVHRFPLSDPGKPCKPKLKRTSKDHSDPKNPSASKVFPSVSSMVTDYGTRVDDLSPFFTEAENLEFESSLLDMYGEVASLDSLEINQKSYLPYLTPELDDFSELPDFTDIG